MSSEPLDDDCQVTPGPTVVVAVPSVRTVAPVFDGSGAGDVDRARLGVEHQHAVVQEGGLVVEELLGSDRAVELDVTTDRDGHLVVDGHAGQQDDSDVGVDGGVGVEVGGAADEAGEAVDVERFTEERHRGEVELVVLRCGRCRVLTEVERVGAGLVAAWHRPRLGSAHHDLADGVDR